MNETLLREEQLRTEVSIERVINDVRTTIKEYCPELTGENLITEAQLLRVSEAILEDLKTRIEQDPISVSEEFMYSLSRSFRAVFYYRIAHMIFNISNGQLIFQACAFRLSENAVLKTGIEIHPEATIGRRFVIDHGLNTLIGATTSIGDDCTLLNNVLLGSRRITDNPKGKRHPSIGNRVKISSGVRILGNIFIGDDCKIGPDCVLKEDVPPNTVVELTKPVSYKTRPVR